MKGYGKFKIVAAIILGLMALTMVYFLVTTNWMGPAAITVICALVLVSLAKFVPWWLKVMKDSEITALATPRVMSFLCMVVVLALSPGAWTGVLLAFNMTGGRWSELTIFCFTVALLASLCALYELLVCIYYLIFPSGKYGRQATADTANV